MKKHFLLGFFFTLLLILPLAMFANVQDAQEVVIDLEAYLGIAAALFATGIGGVTVLGIVEVIKRTLKIQGIAVRILSGIVSAGFVAIYEAGVGFLWYRALIVWIAITLAANGIYLFPKNR